LCACSRKDEKSDEFRGMRTEPSTLHSSDRSEEHTSELQSLAYLVCRLLLEKKKRGAERPPASLVTDSRADASATLWMPPVLDSAFPASPSAGPPTLLARPVSRGAHAGPRVH